MFRRHILEIYRNTCKYFLKEMCFKMFWFIPIIFKTSKAFTMKLDAYEIVIPVALILRSKSPFMLVYHQNARSL
jgi:hypothetical protein